MEDLIKNIEYCIQKDDLQNKCRKRIYVHRRMFFYYVLDKAGYNARKIGEMFGFDRTTVIHGIKSYKQLIDNKDKELLNDIEKYQKQSIFKVRKKVFNLKLDIMNATTIWDLEIIKNRTENNLYKELI